MLGYSGEYIYWDTKQLSHLQGYTQLSQTAAGMQRADTNCCQKAQGYEELSKKFTHTLDVTQLPHLRQLSNSKDSRNSCNRKQYGCWAPSRILCCEEWDKVVI